MATGNAIEISLASELTEGAISFDRLRQITDNFSRERELGTGALGTVYKGILEDGGVIAVKRHVGNAAGTHNTEAHKAKVKGLMEHNHENVVRLLAFCHEKRNEIILHNGRNFSHEVVESLLCYEYLPKGSLQKNLFGELASSILDWNTRFKIIKGICEGVRFLHKSRPPIVHLDLKPQNILLDDNMVPKITDFAYSRLIGEKQTRMYTKSSLGSVGYKAPEYLDHGEISVRTDIYSLGLMILEITTKEKNCPSTDQQSARKFIKSVKTEWTNERILTEYRDLPENCRDELNTCIEIGLRCVNLNQNKRIKIVEIVNRLNGQ